MISPLSKKHHPSVRKSSSWVCPLSDLPPLRHAPSITAHCPTSPSLFLINHLSKKSPLMSCMVVPGSITNLDWSGYIHMYLNTCIYSKSFIVKWMLRVFFHYLFSFLWQETSLQLLPIIQFTLLLQFTLCIVACFCLTQFLSCKFLLDKDCKECYLTETPLVHRGLKHKKKYL